MAEGERVDESTELAEVALLTRRAGLRLSAAELAGMVEAYRKHQGQLRAVRTELAAAEEPVVTFEAAGP